MPTNLNNLKSNYAVSQNDLYGHTQLQDNKEENTNEGVYKKMKNKVSYNSGVGGLNNNGARRMVK